MGKFKCDMSRREALTSLVALGAAGGIVNAASAYTRSPGSAGYSKTFSQFRAASPRAVGAWYQPTDTLPHTRTWMAWPNSTAIWGKKLLAQVQANIATIANNIAEFEPVYMICPAANAAQVKAACSSGVTVIDTIPNNDLWMRDMGPIFLTNGQGGLSGLSMNFNGWGNQQVHNLDALVAKEVLSYLGLSCTVTPFVAEGGAIVTDGLGTGLATATSIVNSNRNPGKTQAQLSTEIIAAFGLTEMLWLPGTIVSGDITDDHIDALAQWVGEAKLVVAQPYSQSETDPFSVDEKNSWKLLQGMKDSLGNSFTLYASDCSKSIPPGESASTFDNVYMNWYPVNGAIMVPAFDDPVYDPACVALAGELFPGRKVVQMRIDGLGAGGGGIHCSTQQQPVAIG